MMKIVLATANPHKVREIRNVLPAEISLVTLADLDIPSPRETGLTFVENAIIKARHAAQHAGLPAIADDSGLTVDYLDGAPGIYSSRYAGEQATDDDNNDRLLAALEGVPQAKRKACFHCVIVMLRQPSDPIPLIAHGSWAGEILAERRGAGGFGYDPLFYVPELGCTAAELSGERKHRLSHRGRALERLRQLMKP